jgi:hypothetical protein
MVIRVFRKNISGGAQFFMLRAFYGGSFRKNKDRQMLHSPGLLQSCVE